MLLSWFVAPASAKVLSVPSEDYPTIQSAVNAARAGDIIEVAAGTYYENVEVSCRQLTIAGEDAATTKVDGDAKDTVFNIQANDVEIRNLTIRNGGRHYNGVNVFYPYGGAVIRNNRIMHNRLGVVLSESDNNRIEDNVFFNNSMYSITARDFSDGTVVKDNVISESTFGIDLSDASLTQVVNNTVSYTSYGVYLAYSNDNNVSVNTVHDTSWNIYLTHSNSNVVGNNQVSGGSVGIQIMRSQGNSVFDNTASDSSYGIYLGYCDGSTVSGNTAVLNDWGLELYDSTGSTIRENTVADNTWGIYVSEDSDGNSLFHNSLSDNIKQAYQDPTSANTWRTSTVPYQGNYWSDYAGQDNDGDGIGDTFLPWSGVDWYPLMNPIHDIAVIDVIAWPSWVPRGRPVYISVIVENQGLYEETFDVIVYADLNVGGVHVDIGTEPSVTLAAEATTTLNFTWDTSDDPYGTYYISAEVTVVPGEAETGDNILLRGAKIGGICVPLQNRGANVLRVVAGPALAMAIMSVLGTVEIVFFKLLMSVSLRWPPKRIARLLS